MSHYLHLPRHVPRSHSRRPVVGASAMACPLPMSARSDIGASEVPKPLDLDARGSNELRPAYLAEMIGQEALKPLLRRIIDVAKASGQPLDHLLLQGASGTGKTTLAQIVAHELGVNVYQVGAPVSLDTFEALRKVMQDRDVLIVDEIHMVVQADRRGITSAADPESFYHILEDRVLVTPAGMFPFPAITLIGATTDAGLLPLPFLNRFPLQPRLAPYTNEEMTRIVAANARAIGLTLQSNVAHVLACASRGTPRLANNYVKNARMLAVGGIVTEEIAVEVITVLNSCTLDGLDLDMQRMLKFLLASRRETRDGHVTYQASVNTIATALGRSRDTKSVALFTEPTLIERGYVQVGHSGRSLTDKGVERARRLGR